MSSATQLSDPVIRWVEKKLTLQDAIKARKELGILIRSSGAHFVPRRTSAKDKNRETALAVPLRTPEALLSWMQGQFTRQEATEVYKALAELLRSWQAIDGKPWMRRFDP